MYKNIDSRECRAYGNPVDPGKCGKADLYFESKKCDTGKQCYGGGNNIFGWANWSEWNKCSKVGKKRKMSNDKKNSRPAAAEPERELESAIPTIVLETNRKSENVTSTNATTTKTKAAGLTGVPGELAQPLVERVRNKCVCHFPKHEIQDTANEEELVPTLPPLVRASPTSEKAVNFASAAAAMATTRPTITIATNEIARGWTNLRQIVTMASAQCDLPVLASKSFLTSDTWTFVSGKKQPS